MRRNHRFFRLTATVALSTLLWDSAMPLAAVAQPAPPPLPPAQAQPDQNQVDPPARVGRVARITGTVSFHTQGDTQWSPASVNYPVSTGNTFWTEPSAEARLEISDSRIALAGGTEFEVATLDINGLQGVAAQGETYLHLRNLAPNEAWSIQTPRGLVRLGGGGRYDIIVGTTEQPTLITVVEGSAQIEGPGVSLQLGANQTATITGIDNFQGSVGPELRSAFLTARLDAERAPPPAAAVPVPPQVIAMPGGSDLYGVGSWNDAPEYGQVWYPPVSPGWVPYREGHWAYVSPWGWTWIDDASWGFAPFHYGRWIQIGGRWAWTPGVVAVAGPPVYAPALVTFIGIGAGVALGAALASGSIGWVPLGPREPFRPWYHASPAYVREVNVNHVTNINNNVINNNVTINNYVNRGAATSVPAGAMTGSRPIQAVARPVSAQEFAAARPIVGQQPLRPTAATVGVTPAVAHQFNLPPTAAVRSAPGPAVRAVAPGPAGAGFPRPALVPAGKPGSVTPTPGPAAAPIAPPVAGRPAPVGPGIRPVPAPAGRPAEPGVMRPAPAAPRPAAPQVTTPRPGPQAEPRPVPQAAPRPLQQAVTPHSAAQPAPQVAPRPAPQVVTPHPAPPMAPQVAPRPAPQVVTPHPAPQVAPRPAPQMAAPRPAPQAAPQPRPEPRAPAAHEKRPGEP